MVSQRQLLVSSEIVCDIETNGLRPTKIHCMVANGEVITTREQAHEWAKVHKGSTVYFHHGYGFDFPVINRIWGLNLLDTFVCRDTLVLSRLANPQREGGHSLEAWGQRLGYPKVEHEDWETYTPEMLNRCRTDVELTKKVLDTVRMELDGFSDESIQLEHDVARIIAKQEQTGWLLNQELCFDLLGELKERQFEVEAEVHTRFVPRCKKVREISPKIKKDGAMSSVGLKFLGDECLDIVGGSFTRVDFPEFNLGSRQQIAEYLIHFGWKPKKTTEKGNVIVDETTLEGVDIPEAQLIAEYLMLGKRIAQVQSWLELVEEDGRVHGQVNSCGAVTNRMTHYNPNMAQVPASRKPYGDRCRQAWTVPKGYKVVGCDANALELVCLAHYMDDPEYTESVANGTQEEGTDVHTRNQRAAGLPTRDAAKTFCYAFLYGAGDAKIGSIVGGSATDGRKLKAQFLKQTPALADLRNKVETAARRGWLKGLDGRRIKVLSQHAALNTLLQSAGAIIMKRALVILDEQIKARGLDAKFIMNCHDEFQLEVREDHVSTMLWLAPSCIAAAGQYYNLRCPLSGSAAAGDNWHDTH